MTGFGAFLAHSPSLCVARAIGKFLARAVAHVGLGVAFAMAAVSAGSRQ
ncbi:hypothetical protein R54767_04757 [Paraburkholderia gardini]|uniref:LysE type translocator n=1 Tax=Paraburkholderia gardini TaxID=2823469 RepID=A0ABM8UAA8_9BURK|nr:hypothetical protein R54767_04757 [Paraburkholderia gardini]